MSFTHRTHAVLPVNIDIWASGCSFGSIASRRSSIWEFFVFSRSFEHSSFDFLLSFINSWRPSSNNIISSIFKYVDSNADLISLFWYDGILRNSSVKWLLTYVDTSLPPCPSNTPKRLVSLFGPRSNDAKWASSIRFLHPCIEQDPKRNYMMII